MAYRAYGEVRDRTASSTTIELSLFRQITAALKEVAASSTPDPASWADALSRNMSLWAILAADLMRPENEMPLEIRTGLINLSEFVRKTSMRVLSGSDEIQDLIDVNITITKGLAIRAGETV
ncbi:MAG: flagellar biosynthesis regulator FlaF [Hyphomonas sp.]